MQHDPDNKTFYAVVCNATSLKPVLATQAPRLRPWTRNAVLRARAPV